MNTGSTNDELASSLGSLTCAPAGYTPAIYADALRRCGRDTASPRRSVLARLGRATPMVAAAAAIILVAAFAVPSIRSPRVNPETPLTGAPSIGFVSESESDFMRRAPSSDAEVLARRVIGYSADQSGDPASAPLTDRVVIRKASVEIRSKDMNGTYAKVSLLLNEAAGEHIQDSQRAGDGASASATITLRVAASRLSEVMNALRALGTVVSESTTGQDVTDQVVDLEARLRNEQRTEAEMLKLMESREGAPLTEILEVRKQVAVVREQIERLTAQRDRTRNLAALATIAVIISPDTEQSPVAGSPFATGVRAAWESGVSNLSGNIAWIVETAVAGAVWWVAIGIGAFALRAAFKRRERSLASEPAPRV